MLCRTLFRADIIAEVLGLCLHTIIIHDELSSIVIMYSKLHNHHREINFCQWWEYSLV